MSGQPAGRGEGPVTDQDRADQARHLAYVRLALPRELGRRGIDWPVGVTGDDRAIVGRLTRGKLKLERDIPYGSPAPDDWPRPWRTPTGQPYWWYPCTREHADELTRELARRLRGDWAHYRDADAGGCLHVQMWCEPAWGLYAMDEFAGARPAEVRLAPGVRLTRSRSPDDILLWSAERDTTATISQAIAWGWAQDLTSPPPTMALIPSREATARQEREARRRIARLVSQYIQRHPAAQSTREAGHDVVVLHDSRAIWAHAVRSEGGTGYQLEARITHPGWWVPVLDSAEDWAARLTTRLARGLRTQWEARDASK